MRISFSRRAGSTAAGATAAGSTAAPRRIALRATAAGALAAGLAVAALAAPMAASAKAGGTSVAEKVTGPDSAVIRGAHFSPNTPGVDVYLSAFSGGKQTIWLRNVGYGDVSPYQRVKPGLYVVSMRAHGAPASSPAALSWTVDAHQGDAYTAAAVGMNAHLKGIVLHDQLNPPRQGTGLVRVIQAASRAPHARLVATPDKIVAANAAFASSTGYANLPAGTWTVTASSLPGMQLSTSSRITIPGSSVNSVVVLDAKGSGLTLHVVRDAAGAAIAPTGAIDAGGGGTAVSTVHDDSSAGLALGGLLLAAGAGCALVAGRRRGPVGNR